MAIAYSSQGAGVETVTSGADLAPLCPATVNANDVLIAHLCVKSTLWTPATPSGWTLLYGPQNIGTLPNGKHWVYGKLADGTEDGAAVAFGTWATAPHRWARVYSFTGWASGTITDNVPAASFSSNPHATDPQGPSVTTTVAGSLAVACMCQTDNNAIAAIAGMSGGTWLESVAEYLPALDAGASMVINSCIPTANPGTVSGGAITAANDPAGTIGFEIRPSAPVAAASLRRPARQKLTSGVAAGSGSYAR